MTEQMETGTEPELLRLAALGPLKAMFQAKRWRELEVALGDRPVWAFDRPLPPAECVRLLAKRFELAEDLHVLVMGNRSRGGGRDGEMRNSYHCCVLWGEVGSWQEHEMEVDLHLGAKADGAGAWRVSYLGLSGR